MGTAVDEILNTGAAGAIGMIGFAKAADTVTPRAVATRAADKTLRMLVVPPDF